MPSVLANVDEGVDPVTTTRLLFSLKTSQKYNDKENETSISLEYILYSRLESQEPTKDNANYVCTGSTFEQAMTILLKLARSLLFINKGLFCIDPSYTYIHISISQFDPTFLKEKGNQIHSLSIIMQSV